MPTAVEPSSGKGANLHQVAWHLCHPSQHSELPSHQSKVDCLGDHLDEASHHASIPSCGLHVVPHQIPCTQHGAWYTAGAQYMHIGQPGGQRAVPPLT